ncbi:AbrB/MazE/SpoVT family DNA-binding domain-containing protein [Chelatococcus sambhunathii]|uniref:AbrB/MazE/SpoVT family DNA-binding domain-containing protein n=1 Tax=Chelatococcus sambhunathii TaxID=363953 RepID=A0ABU1DIG0_9HYPH|nr:AbrB/MazE/SpoVT family DNA-binding domain-containing protein [Chelatococcus sambhunathii]MDR4307916.1 AbrB/MazE/SpoVT family DNA-binding domain-containing protein [Chelatococcus sambhunathii]
MGRFDAKTSLKGQTTIPVEVRRALGLQPGGRVQFITDETGGVRLIAKTTTMRHLKKIFGPNQAAFNEDEAIAETVRRRTDPNRTELDP